MADSVAEFITKKKRPIVKVIRISDDVAVVEGVVRTEKDHRCDMVCTTDDNRMFKPCFNAYERADIQVPDTDIILKGVSFRFDIPLKDKNEVLFFYETEKKREEVKPVIDAYLGFKSKRTYAIRDGYILFMRGKTMCLVKDALRERIAAEKSYISFQVRKDGIRWIGKRIPELKKQREKNRGKLIEKAAFISVRSTDCLQGNMAKVYDALDCPKDFCAKIQLAKDPEYVTRAMHLISTSKLIVTDDYLSLLRNYKKKKGQHIIQLWHATGAGKKFGQDGTSLFPPLDSLTHRDYDIVTVSSEYIRPFYASAFDLPVERILATGVARTDDFFDEQIIDAVKKRTFQLHPEIRDKFVIMYAPTFRDIKGTSRASFNPELDFDSLSSAIKSNMIFAICPHPVMTESILEKEYDNIVEIRDVSSFDMMFTSDLLITDYSSVMFEYALLSKPMAFYCYDYDSYDRDFYMDFEKELPGPLLKTQKELFEYLEKDEYPLHEDYRNFYDKYMSACDGHSTERIVRLIEEMRCS